VETRKIYGSRGYWENYIDSIIDSIQEDKETIIDILVYGRLVEAEVSMILSLEKHPSYEIEIVKMAEKSPFREEHDDE
jgi:hypothetical protein